VSPVSEIANICLDGIPLIAIEEREPLAHFFFVGTMALNWYETKECIFSQVSIVRAVKDACPQIRGYVPTITDGTQRG